MAITLEQITAQVLAKAQEAISAAKAEAQEAISAAKAEALLAAHPVGSVYCSVDSTDPSELFGGTWESIASGRVLQGANDAHAAGSTAEAGLPNITGSISWVGSGYGVNNATAKGAFIRTGYLESGYNTSGAGTLINLSFDASGSNSIYGNSTTVQPPAFFVNIWKRIA